MLIYPWLQKGVQLQHLVIQKVRFWVQLVNLSKLIHLINGPDKKERTKHNEHVRMQKCAISANASTILLIAFKHQIL